MLYVKLDAPVHVAALRDRGPRELGRLKESICDAEGSRL